MTGRIGLTTGANNGNGSLLQEIGTTGVFTGVAPGDVYGIGDQVRAAHARASANPPNAWSSAANSAAALSAHGGDIRRFDQTPQAASLNLTVRQWGTSFDLFPRGIAKSVPDLVNNLQTVTPSHPPGAWALETINRDASLVIGIDNIRINNRTEGKLKDLFASFSKHLREQGALNRVLNVRPGAAPLAAGTVPVEDWRALGRAIPIVAPWGASGAAPNAIAQCGAGSYSHFEETVFGTLNALQGFPNGPAYIANGGPVINNAVLGACPGGCVINALVVTRDPTALAALTAHAGIPGAVWHMQPYPHALREAPIVLFFQLKRWSQKDSHRPVNKDLTPFSFEVGATFDLPLFESARGLQVKWLKYRLVTVLLHTGLHPWAGHYRSILSGCRQLPNGNARWTPMLTDDDRAIRPCTAADMQHAFSNCYLLGLCREVRMYCQGSGSSLQ